MSTEAGMAEAQTGGTGAPPQAPVDGATGSTGVSGGAAPVDPGSSFLATQFDGAAAPTDAAVPAGQEVPGEGPQARQGVAERPEHIKEQFWDAVNGRPKVDELAKSYNSLEHMLGKEKVPVPTDPEDQEAIERWVAAVRPESPDAYTFDSGEDDLPEGMSYDSDLEASFRNIAHQNGLMPHQAKALHDQFFKLQTQRYNDWVQGQQEARLQAQHAMQRKYGSNYANEERAVRNTLSKYGSPDLVEAMNESGYGNDPRFFEFIANISKDLNGQQRLVGTPQMEGSPQDIQAAIASYREKHHKALYDRDHQNHKGVVEGLNNLYRQLHGDTPAA